MRNPRVLVVTSAGPREGKSTVTANLGIALAEAGKRVLLVDGDPRRPRLHEIFNLPNQRGLTDLVIQPLPDSVLANEIGMRTQIDRISVLTSGEITKQPNLLLYSANLQRVLEKLNAEFDTIIIDTPPVLYMPDARVFSRHADGVILVARVGETTRDELAAVTLQLMADGTRVLGTVLNDWRPTARSGGYARAYRRYIAVSGDSSTR
jgi:capsular exopolysaccharide synthesis family protein